jgi:transposase
MQQEAAPEQAAMVEHHREHQMLRSTPSTLRRLMIFAASTVVRSAKRKDVAPGSWLARMLARKPPMVVIVALANENARIAWALPARGGVYRAPAVA